MKEFKVLLCGNTESVYITEIQEKLGQVFNIVDVFDISKGIITSKEGIIKCLCKKKSKNKSKIYDVLRYVNESKYFAKLKLRYDVINIHYNDPAYSIFFRKIFIRSCNRLIITVWGSDFNRKGKILRKIQSFIYNKADYITFNNKEIKDAFNNYYKRKYYHKLKELYFGIENVEKMKNLQLEEVENADLYTLLKNKIVITVGYNGISHQRHLEIINEILRVQDALDAKCIVVFPLTYGLKVSYLKLIKERLRKLKLPYYIFDQRLSDRDILILRLASDILIHVQDTDSFSASVQEYLYAGNVVINGSWLPYERLRELGIFDLKVKKIKDLRNILPEVVSELISYKHKASKNKDIIWTISSWDNQLPRWIECYITNN